MYRLIYRLLLGLWFTPAIAVAQFQEGVHYQDIAFPQAVETGEKIEVREFFWYGCPHCYDLEPGLKRWLKTLPANAQFILLPAVTPRWEPHARVFYAFEALGMRGKLHVPFFDAIHKDKRKLNDLDSMAAFAAEQGVDKDAFRRAYRSFGVNLQVEQARKVGEAYLINSVPILIVDGKYLTSPRMAGGSSEMLKLLDYLIGKAAGERKKAGARR